MSKTYTGTDLQTGETFTITARNINHAHRLVVDIVTAKHGDKAPLQYKVVGA